MVLSTLFLLLLVLARPCQCWTSRSPQSFHRFFSSRTSSATSPSQLLASPSSSSSMEVWLDLHQCDETDISKGCNIPEPARSHLDSVGAVLIASNDDDSIGFSPDLIGKTHYVVDNSVQQQPPRGGVQRFYESNKDPTNTAGAIVDVSAPSGQDEALGLIGSVEWILITCNTNNNDNDDDDKGWPMITAENLISACQNTGTKVAATVDRAGDVGGLARALELGVDALCIDGAAADAVASDIDLWEEVIAAKEERRQSNTNADDANGSSTVEPRLVQGMCQRLTSSGQIPVPFWDSPAAARQGLEEKSIKKHKTTTQGVKVETR